MQQVGSRRVGRFESRFKELSPKHLWERDWKDDFCFIRYLPLKAAKWDINLRMRAQSPPKVLESAKRIPSSDVPATEELTGSVQAVKLIALCVSWAPQQSRLQTNGFWLCSQANANIPWSQNHRMVPSCPPLQLSKDWKNSLCETFSQVIKRYSGFPVLHVSREDVIQSEQSLWSTNCIHSLLLLGALWTEELIGEKEVTFSIF